ncbi:MAG: Methyltransferase type 11 [Ilumatobacteraceae bacterium]|nr:Methyltransferase type 11 [Ilumatobacteraceae bacterium]
MGEIEISHDESHGATPWAYTHGHADAVLRSHRWRTAQNSAAYLLPRLGPGLRVLDVGCGPGTLTADLAERVAPGATHGIDLEPSVIAEARRVASDRGMSTLTFEAADVHELTEPGGYDVVHAHQVLQHVPDPVSTLRAMRDQLSQGGVVAARDADYSAMTWWPHDPLIDRWLEIYRAVTQRNGAQCDAGRRLLHWARQAGFDEVQYTTSTWTFSSPADLDWWCQLWADRVTGSRFGQQAIEFGISDLAELSAIAEGWRQWGRSADAVFIVPHGEIIAERP